MSEGSLGTAAPLARSATAERDDPLSIPYVILSAVLIGAGIFLIFDWIATFNWPAFGGILLLALGALMLFSPRAGADRSR